MEKQQDAYHNRGVSSFSEKIYISNNKILQSIFLQQTYNIENLFLQTIKIKLILLKNTIYITGAVGKINENYPIRI